MPLVRSRLIPVIVLLTVAFPGRAAVLRVKAGAPGTVHDGAAWNTAFTTVQAAINAAQPSDEIWVAAGSYAEALTLKEGVDLYGGFTGTEETREARNPIARTSVLDGGGARTVLTAPAGVSGVTEVDGFLIRNGKASQAYSGGAATLDGSPTLRNNTFTANRSLSGGAVTCRNNATPTIVGNVFVDNGEGPAILSNNSAPTIENNTIAGSQGGGVLASGGTVMIRANVIQRNGANGGVCLVQCAASVLDNVISGNGATKGAGISCTGVTGEVRRNRVTGNVATYYGGVYIQDSALSFTDNIVAGNGAAGDIGALAGGGVTLSGDFGTVANNTICWNSAERGGGVSFVRANGFFINNIVAFNRTGVTAFPPLAVTFTHNDVFGNGGLDYDGLDDGTGQDGNIAKDPLFVDGAHGDFHLRTDSPCRDVGDNSAASGDSDKDGQPRVQPLHGIVDIGAYESDGTERSSTARTVRVSPSGDDASDGASWTAAKKTVAAALATVADAGGGEVWCAAGTYPENVVFGAFTFLRGGFAGTESAPEQRTVNAGESILDGAAGSTVTVAAGAMSCGLDLFTVQHRAPLQGTGVMVGGGALPLITSNAIRNNVSSFYGGGVYCNAASAPTLRGNTVEMNAAITGAGLYCRQGARPTLTGNTVRANRAYGSGGGMASESSSPTLLGNHFIGNTARDGGAFSATGSVLTARNNIFAGNSALFGGGALGVGSKSQATVANNTFAAGDAQSGGAVFVFNESDITLANNIIALGSSGVARNDGTWPASSVTLAHNLFFGNRDGDTSGLDAVGPLWRADPGFAAPAYGDFHIQPDSPAVDAADAAYVVPEDTDMDGQRRTFGAADVGADESYGQTIVAAPRIVRVKPDGDDRNDGSSWSAAKASVGRAAEAAGFGGEVWVAAGTYTGRVFLPAFTYLYGGFAGGETERSARDPKANVTLLDGARTGSVVRVRAGYVYSAVDGFTIRNGLAESFVNSNLEPQGGGVSLEAASGYVTNNRITGNEAREGGGVGAYGGAPTIARNLIADNVTGPPDRASGYGGGVALSRSNARVLSNLVHANGTDGFGSGVYSDRGNVTVANNTIVENTGSFEALWILGGTVENNIVAFNDVGAFGLDASDGTPMVADRNIVYGNADPGHGFPYGMQPLREDPLFADRAAGDFHLLPGSPGLDAGLDLVMPGNETDLDGRPRKQGIAVDIGAYESAGPLPRAMVDAIAALRAAGGLSELTDAEKARLNVATADASAGVVDVLDAVAILRAGS